MFLPLIPAKIFEMMVQHGCQVAQNWRPDRSVASSLALIKPVFERQNCADTSRKTRACCLRCGYRVTNQLPDENKDMRMLSLRTCSFIDLETSNKSKHKHKIISRHTWSNNSTGARPTGPFATFHFITKYGLRPVLRFTTSVKRCILTTARRAGT